MTNQTPVASVTSNDIWAALTVEAGNERRRETLTRLKFACDSLEATGTPFQLTNLQRVIEAKFGKDAGPKAQSISNERKRPLGMYHYVEAREREAAASRRRARSNVFGGTKATAKLIDRIDDIDARSAMQDLYDRLQVAEKGLTRAKAILKTLSPGADWQALMNGTAPNRDALGSMGPASEVNVMSLQRLVNTLTDNTKLDAVGLHYDGRRVRRKTGTRDELFDPKTLSDVQALVNQLLPE